MALPDDKTTLNFVLDKSLKHKLQILANSEDRKLGNYVAIILEQHVIDFEKKILETYGDGDWEKEYYDIFGTDFEPHLYSQLEKDFDRLMPQTQHVGIPRVSSNRYRSDMIFANKYIEVKSTIHTKNEYEKNTNSDTTKNFWRQVTDNIMKEYLEKVSKSVENTDSPLEAMEHLQKQGVTKEMILLLSNPPFSEYLQTAGRVNREIDKKPKKDHMGD